MSSQADTQEADMVREGKELDTDDKFERAELAEIYVSRGLDPDLAWQVSDQLMVHDALGAHARDELGISEIQHARPVLAAFASAGTFAVGAALPLMVVLLAPAKILAVSIVGTSARVLGDSWVAGSQRRRRESHRQCHTRNILGCTRNGTDVWRWCRLW